MAMFSSLNTCHVHVPTWTTTQFNLAVLYRSIVTRGTSMSLHSWCQSAHSARSAGCGGFLHFSVSCPTGFLSRNHVHVVSSPFSSTSRALSPPYSCSCLTLTNQNNRGVGEVAISGRERSCHDYKSDDCSRLKEAAAPLAASNNSSYFFMPMAIKTIRASKTKATHVIARTFAERAVDQKARREYRSFEDARTYVHTLGLKSAEEWRAWRASDARPHDIPSNPYHEYASSGWLSYGDFLGYAVGKVTGNFRSFEDARAYVHKLGLMSQKEWKAWRRSGARPHDIPSVPETHYASSGWLSYGDFLGYAVGKEVQFRPRTNFRSFEDARAYVHTLGLMSSKEWEAWSASRARPYDIPSDPDRKY